MYLDEDFYMKGQGYFIGMLICGHLGFGNRYKLCFEKTTTVPLMYLGKVGLKEWNMNVCKDII